MIGAIIGDIAGSRFEFNNTHSKNFDMFVPTCFATDDSYMTLAIAKAFLNTENYLTNIKGLQQNTIKYMQQIAESHKDAGYGLRFYKWLFENPVPYNSLGNGAGMRVSPVGWVAKSEDEVKVLSRAVTEISHNHPEGIKGAEAISMAVYLAKNKASKSEIKQRMIEYYPQLEKMSMEKLYNEYFSYDWSYWITCEGSVPQALTAFFESESFEDAIKNAVCIGGDSDTLACMAGAVSEAYYGVDISVIKQALGYLSGSLQNVYYAFRNKFMGI